MYAAYFVSISPVRDFNFGQKLLKKTLQNQILPLINLIDIEKFIIASAVYFGL